MNIKEDDEIFLTNEDIAKEIFKTDEIIMQQLP